MGFEGFSANEIKVLLREPDLTTASNVANALNTAFGDETAMAVDASEITVTVPKPNRKT